MSALRLKQRDATEDFLRVPALAVTDTAIDLTQRQVVVGGVSTQKGFLGAKRLADGEVDLQKLIAPPPAGQGQAAAPAGPEQKPWIITLKRLAVDQYTAKVEDRAASEPITLAVEKIRLHAENLSTAKNSTGKVALSLVLDQTAAVKVNTTVGLDPLRADGKAEITGVVLNRYAPYYKNLVAFDVQDGVLDAATGYRVSQEQGRVRRQAGGPVNLDQDAATEDAGYEPGVPEHPRAGGQEYRGGSVAAGRLGGRPVHGARHRRRISNPRRRDQPRADCSHAPRPLPSPSRTLPGPFDPRWVPLPFSPHAPGRQGRCHLP